MASNKSATVAVVEDAVEVKGSTVHDQLEMTRMGKTQQLRVSLCPQ